MREMEEGEMDQIMADKLIDEYQSYLKNRRSNDASQNLENLTNND